MRELILKRYQRGMTAEQIAALDDLTLEYVEEVISSSGIQPINRKKVTQKNVAQTISDEELTKRIESGETRYSIERSLEVETGTLSSRYKRLSKLVATRKSEEKKRQESEMRAKQREQRNQTVIQYANEGMTFEQIVEKLGLHRNTTRKIVQKLGLKLNKPEKKVPILPTKKQKQMDERNQRIIDCAKKGMTFKEIVTELDLNVHTARSTVQKLGLTLNKGENPLKGRSVAGVSGQEFYALAKAMLEEGKTLKEIGEVAKVTSKTATDRIKANKELHQIFINRKVTQPRAKRKQIDLELVEKLLNEGRSLRQIAKETGIGSYLLRARVKENPKLDQLAKENETVIRKKNGFSSQQSNKKVDQSTLAAQEIAVTTECDGFAENYTIAALMKEEEQMTEAIAEVKQETEERDVRNDKWVHFVANQIEHAKVKTKFDVVQEGQKYIKRTEVRFVIEEVL